MIRNMLRRWLGVPAPGTESVPCALNDIAHKREQYITGPHMKYFTLEDVENGKVLTMRVYGDSSHAQNYGKGPSYLEKVYVIPSNVPVADTLISALVTNKIFEK